MMKIYQKKNANFEDETALVHLDRRHTLKEVPNEVNSEDVRKTTRAKSLGIFEEGESSTDIEAVTTGKKSGFTRRPTIITESELSSSSLYKERKAKINSDDESVEDPRSIISPENHEVLEPRALHDPHLRPVPVSSQRPRKMSSCCWYFAIILVICIACLSVMAGVGGIIYMEYFATYEDKLDITDTATLVKNNKNPSDSKEIFQYPPHKQDNLHLNEPKIPEHILKDVIKNSATLTPDTDVSRKVPAIIFQPKEDIFSNRDLFDSNNSRKKALHEVSRKIPVIVSQPKEDMFRNRDLSDSNHSRKKALNEVSRKEPVIVSQPQEDIFRNRDLSDSSNMIHEVESSFVSKSQDIEITEHSKTAEHSDIFQNNRGRINRFNVPVSDKSVEIKRSAENQDSLDLKLNYESIDGIKDKIPDGPADDVKEQMTGNESIFHEKSNSETEVSDSSEETLDSRRNFNFGELKVEQVNGDTQFQNLPKENRIEHSFHPLQNSNYLEHLKNSLDNKYEDNFFDHRKQSIHDPEDNSLDHPEHSINHDPEDNSLDHPEHSINHSLEDNSLDHAEHFINNNKSLDDHNEDSNDFDSHSSSEERSLADDHNQNSDDSAQLVFIRPVVESKAVPVPLAFLRRIGFDIKNPNSHQPITAEDMDIKFSLAEALKYLRSLDTDNKLPVSREKNVPRERSNQEENKKTKLPLISERKEYLNVLRKKMFEQSL